MPASNISPGNVALQFIDRRIIDNNYRGSYSSEHNRYTMKKVVCIFELLNKYAPNQELMTIRTTDISKRPENNLDEMTYAKFCDEVKGKTGIGTQDALRKNLFPDFHRMGFIYRYSKEGKKIDPFYGGTKKFISLTDQGVKLIKAKTILEQFLIFSKGIDKLLGGYIDLLLSIFQNDEYKIKSINIFEFMFFITAIGSDYSFNISIDQAIELIKNYRNLSRIQCRSVIDVLKQELVPDLFAGDKNNKRDFHNWLNKAQQAYYLLNQTAYFDVRGENLYPKSITGDLKEISIRLKRSLNEKDLYFKNNEINQTKGFELHHIVPISWAESIYHLKILDKWENMVYIDGFSHAKITQNKNRNVILSTNKDDIKLSDYSNNQVYLKYKENIFYKLINKEIMQSYNKKLLNTVK